MARAKGSGKAAGSGRAAGTPNRRTVEVMETLAAAGFDPDAPFLFWARVLRSGMAARQAARVEKFLVGHTLTGAEIWGRPPIELVTRAAAELAAYVAPKRKAVEVSGAGGGPVPVLLLHLEELAASGVGVKGAAAGAPAPGKKTPMPAAAPAPSGRKKR